MNTTKVLLDGVELEVSVVGTPMPYGLPIALLQDGRRIIAIGRSAPSGNPEPA